MCVRRKKRHERKRKDMKEKAPSVNGQCFEFLGERDNWVTRGNLREYGWKSYSGR
jgi:hypothetical protein